MALIKCRGCGSEISSRAECCPNCGAKTRFGMNEQDRKQMNTVALVLILVSLVGTFLFFSGWSTMMSDINRYNSSWYGGYNYKSPLTEHEMGVIMKMIFGGAIDIGCTVGAISLKKNRS